MKIRRKYCSYIVKKLHSPQPVTHIRLCNSKFSHLVVETEELYYQKCFIKKCIDGYMEMSEINISMCEMGWEEDMEDLFNYESRL